MRKQYVRRKNTMKKFLATVLTIVFVLSISCPAYAAMTPADLEGESDGFVRISEVYSNEDLSFQHFETLLKEAASNGNDPAPLWVIVSLNDQQNSQFYYFPDKGLKEVETYYYDTFWNNIDKNVDFIQTGVVLNSQNKESIENSFEENPLETAINLLMSDSEKAQKSYQSIQEFNTRYNIPETPVFWNIDEINSENFIVEVSLGQYKIQPGDCLSILAERFGTTVEQLVKHNKKITDPDLIYAGDSLAIVLD